MEKQDRNDANGNTIKERKLGKTRKKRQEIKDKRGTARKERQYNKDTKEQTRTEIQ